MKTKSIIIKIIFILAAVFCLSSCGAKSGVAEYSESEAVRTELPTSFAAKEKISEEKIFEEEFLQEKTSEEIVPEEKPSEAIKPSAEVKPSEQPKAQELSPEPSPKLSSEPSPEPSSEPLAEPEADSETVKMSIYGIDSFILSETEVSLEEDQTVFDILKKVTREQEIPLDFNGRGSKVYISGIDNIYEFDNGPESGWIYYVNGSYPNKSCGAYELNEGDVIEWKYTDKLVKDIF